MSAAASWAPSGCASASRPRRDSFIVPGKPPRPNRLHVQGMGEGHREPAAVRWGSRIASEFQLAF